MFAQLLRNRVPFIQGIYCYTPHEMSGPVTHDPSPWVPCLFKICITDDNIFPGRYICHGICFLFIHFTIPISKSPCVLYSWYSTLPPSSYMLANHYVPCTNRRKKHKNGHNAWWIQKLVPQLKEQEDMGDRKGRHCESWSVPCGGKYC